MKHVEFVFFDAGGGHRASATALCEVIQSKGYPWHVRMTNLQELLDRIDIVRRTTGVRIQDVYNAILKRGWTLGSPHLLKVLQAAVRFYHREEVRILEEQWRQSKPDLVVSVIPHFNRALRKSLSHVVPGAPFVTLLTDLADYPPHFWIEPLNGNGDRNQFVICGSEKAVRQAGDLGIPQGQILRSSGMIIHPRFYEPVRADRSEERRRLGLEPDVPTCMVMFGGQGSWEMVEIAERLESAGPPLQLILICGGNRELAERLRRSRPRVPRFVEGFTKEVPYYMHLADFFIGKPGPGSISEALAMKLPVIVQNSAWTLPQERYNTQWVLERGVGLVVKSFREIGPTVGSMLQSGTLSRLQANLEMLNNRAVFEIPEMLAAILNSECSALEHSEMVQNR